MPEKLTEKEREWILSKTLDDRFKMTNRGKRYYDLIYAKYLLDWITSEEEWLNYTHALVHHARAGSRRALRSHSGDKKIRGFSDVITRITDRLTIHNAKEQRAALIIVFKNLIKYIEKLPQ